MIYIIFNINMCKNFDLKKNNFNIIFLILLPKRTLCTFLLYILTYKTKICIYNVLFTFILTN